MSLKLLLRDKEIFPPYLVRKPEFSEDEYFQITDEDSLCELFYGELIMHSPASKRHEELFGFLLSLFKIYEEKKRLGIVLGSRFAMRLGRDVIVEPDIIFIERKRKRNLKDTFLEGPCNLVVEIVSKTTRNYDLSEKRWLYREHSIPEIWFIDPESKLLIVDSLSGSSYKTKNIRKGVYYSTALRGFFLQTSWLWEEPLPPVTNCIEKIIKHIISS
jgi:Uma2 family endonuclease